MSPDFANFWQTRTSWEFETNTQTQPTTARFTRSYCTL